MPRTRNVPVRKAQSRELHQLRCPHPECNRAFKNKSGLTQHYRVKHHPTSITTGPPAPYPSPGLRSSPVGASGPGLPQASTPADSSVYHDPSPSRSHPNQPPDVEAHPQTPPFNSPHHSDVGAGPYQFTPPGNPSMDIDPVPQTPPPGSPYGSSSAQNPHRSRPRSRQREHDSSSPMGRAQARRSRGNYDKPNRAASKTYHPIINGMYDMRF
jgi:hypothetical protein